MLMKCVSAGSVVDALAVSVLEVADGVVGAVGLTPIQTFRTKRLDLK